MLWIPSRSGWTGTKFINQIVIDRLCFVSGSAARDRSADSWLLFSGFKLDNAPKYSHMNIAIPAATATAPAADNTAQRTLEEFVANNDDLERLELLLRKFNLFEALKLVWHEVRHSDFLAYLLDPQQNHGLSDRFLKAMLQSAVKGGANSSVTPIDVDVWNLTSAEVHREWQNIDIFVRDETNRLAVIVENKVQSEEHSNQLARYYELVAKEYAGWRIVAIYLTREGDSPSDERFIACGYDQVCDLVEKLVNLNGPMLDNGVRIVVGHYAEMLRRHLVTESEISELCRRIYAKHKQALDLIYEHRPDRQQMVRELLEQWIGKNPDLELDHCTKSYIRFIPKKLDTEMLRQGAGWTSTGRMLLFEFLNTEDNLSVKVVIGPGPTEIRQRLFDAAHAKKPLLKPFAKFYQQWNTIFTHKLLSPKSYELPDGEFTAELEKQLKRFAEKELQEVVGAIDEQTWIHTPMGTM